MSTRERFDTPASEGSQVSNVIETPKIQTFVRYGYEPTPREIRQACEKIRATWSPRDRASRSMVRLAELIAAIKHKRMVGELKTLTG